MTALGTISYAFGRRTKSSTCRRAGAAGRDGWYRHRVRVGVNSGVLLTVNVLAINFTGLLPLWHLGYRPQSWISADQSYATLLRRGTMLFIALLVTSAFLWNASYASMQRSQPEEAVENDISELFDSDRYDRVSPSRSRSTTTGRPCPISPTR